MGPRKSGVVGQKQPGREDPPGMASKNEHSVLNPKHSIDNLSSMALIISIYFQILCS